MTFLPWTTIKHLLAFLFFSLFAVLLAVLAGICFSEGNDAAGILLAVAMFTHGIIVHANFDKIKHSYRLWRLEKEMSDLNEEALWIQEARRALDAGEYETMYEAMAKVDQYRTKRKTGIDS